MYNWHLLTVVTKVTSNFYLLIGGPKKDRNEKFSYSDFFWVIREDLKKPTEQKFVNKLSQPVSVTTVLSAHFGLNLILLLVDFLWFTALSGHFCLLLICY